MTERKQQEFDAETKRRTDPVRKRMREAHAQAQGRISVPKEILDIAIQAVMDALLEEMTKGEVRQNPSSDLSDDANRISEYMTELLNRLKSDPYSTNME